MPPPSSSFPALPWPVVETPLSRLLKNAEATLVEIHHPDAVIPVVVPDLEPRLDPRERAWVTCMESGLVGYVIEEWSRTRTPTRLQSAFLGAYAFIGRCGPWRRAVQVGNLPFSTTLRTEASNRVLWEILPILRESMPDRPFAVRNVYPPRQEIVLPKDARLLPARPIYRFDYEGGKVPKSSVFKCDVKLLQKSGLIRIVDRDFDERRILEGLDLYSQLYRGKHSRRNPNYTREMIQIGRERGWLSLRGLVDPQTDRLVSFAGVHELGRAISAPLIGYDTHAPKKAGLYRQLLAQLACEAIDRGMIDDSSSGAGEFKRNRGQLPELESFAVMPPLAGIRRWSDRAVIRLQYALTRNLTLEQLIADGG